MTTDFETAHDSGAGHVSAEDLSAYIDGELEHENRVLVEAHLASCRQCRDELAALSWTVEFARAMPRTQVPPGVSFRIPVGEPASLDDHPGRTGLSMLAWGSMAVAAAAVVLAVLQSGQPAVTETQMAAVVPPPMAAAPMAAVPTTSATGLPSGANVGESAADAAEPSQVAQFSATEVVLGDEIGGAGDMAVTAEFSAESAAEAADQSAARREAEQVATDAAATRSLGAVGATPSPVAESARVPSGPRAAALAPQSETNSAARWFAVALAATALAAAAFALGRRSRG